MRTKYGMLLAVIWAMCGSAQSWAAGELHLNFHMGGSVNGSGFVGGTLINTGDEPVAHGYAVVTLLDIQCRPLKSVIESFDSIAAGETRSFRIAVDGELKRYRLLSIKGFDANGFELVAIDDNEAIVKARETAERAYCGQSKHAVAN
ncbi:FxLYD domain-containing protein [Pseudomonas sp. CP4]|uniref:FxLYD domain-containing protein n=1 Tax=Pseudomonas sp. CP4 TaxID=3388844 RepID=UPI0039EFDE7D